MEINIGDSIEIEFDDFTRRKATIMNIHESKKIIRYRFERPSPSDVTEYAKSIGFILDGNNFCDFYETRGWIAGKTPMKNWKAAVRTWKKNQGGGVLGQAKNKLGITGEQFQPSKQAIVL